MLRGVTFLHADSCAHERVDEPDVAVCRCSVERVYEILRAVRAHLRTRVQQQVQAVHVACGCGCLHRARTIRHVDRRTSPGFQQGCYAVNVAVGNCDAQGLFHVRRKPFCTVQQVVVPRFAEQGTDGCGIARLRRTPHAPSVIGHGFLHLLLHAAFLRKKY
jgi:hypothetical protein